LFLTLLHFDIADWVLIAAYVATILIVGFRHAARNRRTAGEFLLGGRLLTLPGFIAGLVSTWYGGILGIGEFTWRNGLSNWLVFGVPYYIFALVFAFTMVRRVRSINAVSIPDSLYATYGKPAGMLGSVFVYFISSPAPYFLMLGVLIQVVTGWPLVPALIIGTLLSVVFVHAGGFKSVVNTDILQFVLMFSGFILILMYLVPQYGLGFIASHVPPGHLRPTGDLSIQYIVVWFFIALLTLVAPTFHQFVQSAKDDVTARRGIVTSVLCWIVFDSTTTLTGLYSRALLPDLVDPGMAFPILGQLVLPSAAKAVFYLGMVSTVMSTAVGLGFIASMTLGRDVFGRAAGRLDDASVNRYTRIGVWITAVVGVASALLFPSVINLWYVIGTIFIPGLLVPYLATIFKSILLPKGWTFAAMLAAFCASLTAFVIGRIMQVDGSPVYPLNIEPMYHGLVLSIVIYAAGLLRTKRRVNL
jgi:SSS family solute:Na+ symporter